MRMALSHKGYDFVLNKLNCRSCFSYVGLEKRGVGSSIEVIGTGWSKCGAGSMMYFRFRLSPETLVITSPGTLAVRVFRVHI